MPRKGQLALYVIIAMLIIVIAIASFLVYNQIKKTTLSSSEISIVKDYIKGCFESKSKEGILLIAKQGGYYELPNESINFLEQETAFYLKSDKKLVPPKALVERQLELWLYNNSEDCFSIPRPNIEAEKNFTIKARLLETNETEIDVKGIKIKKAETNAIIDFNIILNSDLLTLLNASNEIVNEYSKTLAGYLCIECLDAIAIKHNLNLTIVPVTKDIFRQEHIWFLLNSSQQVDNKFLIWRFVTELK